VSNDVRTRGERDVRAVRRPERSVVLVGSRGS
jgi:hypothetical protein